jgi:hypothetical protein
MIETGFNRTEIGKIILAVIGSAVVPTLIAQRWFQPKFKPISSDVEEAQAVAGEEP